MLLIFNRSSKSPLLFLSFPLYPSFVTFHSFLNAVAIFIITLARPCARITAFMSSETAYLRWFLQIFFQWFLRFLSSTYTNNICLFFFFFIPDFALHTLISTLYYTRTMSAIYYTRIIPASYYVRSIPTLFIDGLCLNYTTCELYLHYILYDCNYIILY